MFILLSAQQGLRCRMGEKKKNKAEHQDRVKLLKGKKVAKCSKQDLRGCGERSSRGWGECVLQGKVFDYPLGVASSSQ